MRRATALMALLLLLAPALVLALDGRASSGGALAFGAPVRLNPADGWGYEPGMRIDAAGNLFVTAHKSGVNEGTRLSSWLWWSTDDGATWSDIPSPELREKGYLALEGDLAVDALDRLYFVDTYGADNTITRWLPGAVWDYSAPVMPTSGVDDRPWIAAHGDGVLYYMGNNGAPAPNPGGAVGSSTVPPPARYFISTSTDGGHTWSLGRGFPNSSWCHHAASPVDDVTVLVVCHTLDAQSKVVAYRSGDRGATWSITTIATMRDAPGEFPTVAFDRAGNAYTAWSDIHDSGDRLYVARSIAGGAWSVQQLTGATAAVERVWVAAGDAGTVAVSYYGSTKSARSTPWHVYTHVTADATAANPAWQAALVDPVAVTVWNDAPLDFFQNAVGPDNRVYVTYGRDATAGLTRLVDYTQDILVVRQTDGPNL